MKQFTKAYLMVVMLALSTVSFGLGGHSGIGSAEAQHPILDECVEGATPPSDYIENATGNDCEEAIFESADPGVDPMAPLQNVSDAVEFATNATDGNANDDYDPDCGGPDEGSTFNETYCDNLHGLDPVPEENSDGSRNVTIPIPLGLPIEVTSILFPDEGSSDGINQIVLPPLGPELLNILDYQDSDGDGYSDLDELNGCGDGRPINPWNPEADCDNYDGDQIDNDDDPNPYTVDTLLVLTGVTGSAQVAPVTGDTITIHYQCFNGLNSLSANVKSIANSDTTNGVILGHTGSGITTGFSPDGRYDSSQHASDGSNCHARGNLTLPASIVFNVTNSVKGNHIDGLFNVTMEGTSSSSGGLVATDGDVRFTVTNAAEDGIFTATCMLNLTTDGYCGEPGNSNTLHGVDITYDANRFPDKHPHPGVPVNYTINWTFEHTSYLSGDGHNLSKISIENYLSDGNCTPDNPRELSFQEYECGDTSNRTDEYEFDAPNGTFSDGTPFYNMTSYFLVQQSGTTGSTGHNRYMTAELIDVGGTRTYFGELDKAGSSDDHDKFTHFMPKASHLNDVPEFVSVGGTHAGHDNTTRPSVLFDDEDKKLYLRAAIEDDGAYSRVDTPGEAVNVTISYALTASKDDLPSAGDYTHVHELSSATITCTPGSGGTPIVPPPADECDYENKNNGSPNDLRDGNTADKEAFEFSLAIGELEAGRTIHYKFHVEDEAGAFDDTTLFTFDIPFLDEIPLDDDGEPIVDLTTLIGVLSTVNGSTTDGLPSDGGDLGDVWDSDEDGKFNDPNGQPDLVERYVIHYDLDEGDDDHDDDFDGTQGLTVHLQRSQFPSATERDHIVLRVGDAASTEDQFEAVVLTGPGIGVLCVLEQPGQVNPEIRAATTHQFDPERDEPCGGRVDGTDALNLKVVRTDTAYTLDTSEVGFILYNDVDNDDQRDGAEDRRSRPQVYSPEDILAAWTDETGELQVRTNAPGSDPPNQSPEEPRNVQANDNLEDPSTRVDLSWAKAQDDNDAVSHYRVYWAEDREPTIFDNRSADIAAEDLEFTVEELEPLTKYNFSVRAYDEEGASSGLSDPVAHTTSADEVDPLPPTDLTAVLNSSNPSSSIDLEWTASTDNIGVAGYRILFSNTSATSGYSEVESLWTYTNYTHTGLDEGKTHHYLVAAVDVNGNRGDYASASAKTDPAPSAPSGLVAARNATDSTSSVDLNWTAATDNGDIHNYTVHVSTVSGAHAASSAPVASLDNATFEYTVTGLTDDTLHYFVVKANDTFGTFGPASNVATNHTNDFPAAPTGFVVEQNSSNPSSSMDLNWTEPTDAIGGVASYNVYHATGTLGSGSPSSDWALLASDISGVEYVATGLSASTQHFFNVSAVDTYSVEGAHSATMDEETDSEGNEPTNATNIQVVRGTNDPTSELNVSWDPATDDEGPIANYTVYWAGPGQANVTTHANQNKTTDDDSTFLLVTGLASNTTYNFTVHSRDTAGNVNTTAIWVSGTTGEAPTDPVITGVDPNASSPEQVLDVNWTASEDYEGLSHYTVYWAESSTTVGHADNNTTVADTVTIASIGGLAPNSNYCFIVEAVDVEGNTADSGIQCGTTDGDTEDPSAPGTLSAVLNASAPETSANLTWSAATDNVAVDEYHIKRSESSGGPYLDVGITDADTFEFSDVGLDPATTYYYVIRAVDAADNEGFNSNEATVTTESDDPNVKDSDGDGVVDANDDCANTPEGAEVDENGCEVDDEGTVDPVTVITSVIVQLCDVPEAGPVLVGTLSEVFTEASCGPPVDSDGDGTPDDEDAFPNDPDEDTDSDGDGIGDNSDPDNNDGPKGDKDGDGIDNEHDLSNDGNQVPDQLEEPGVFEICINNPPVIGGKIGICYSESKSAYYVMIGPYGGPKLPL